ncbi:hypothetical protein N7468_008041 [Penicillium chermesinum]|uniref:Uncharacterized protein n=1 Tax=Penicillium chermesinum TaxID=63820 RepID=A0A9W9NP12_9EURO|nr:uncharacterized protein N7468_008041 [Penicillium chermesinum]KAJ5223499.1 hypothetical protein N7468_008041 [Penicillium chermesinum]
MVSQLVTYPEHTLSIYRADPKQQPGLKPQAFYNAMDRGERNYDIKAQDIQCDSGTANGPSKSYSPSQQREQLSLRCGGRRDHYVWSDV